MKHQIFLNFITGFSVGLELFLGDDLEENDKFACNIDLGIFRMTYVLSES
jgi:hypothetical protein